MSVEGECDTAENVLSRTLVLGLESGGDGKVWLEPKEPRSVVEVHAEEASDVRLDVDCVLINEQAINPNDTPAIHHKRTTNIAGGPGL